MTHWSFIHQSGHKWNCCVHTLGLLSVGVSLGYLYGSCGEVGSSFGNRDLKNDHIYGTLYIGNFWQVSETPLCELNHHTYCTYLYSCALFCYCNASLPGLLLGFQESCGVLAPAGSLNISFVVSSSWKFHSLVLQKIDLVICRSPATCLMWHVVALEFSSFFVGSLTLLAGNLSKSTLPSVMVLGTKSSSHRKKQKKYLGVILLCLGGYCEINLHLNSIAPFVDVFVTLAKTF